MLKGAVKINSIITPQGFFLDDFVNSLVLTLARVCQLPFFYCEDRSFRVDFRSSPAVKPVDGATIADPVWSDDGAMGRSKTLT